MDKNRKKRTLGILRLTVLNGAFLLLCLVALVPVLYALTLSFSGSGAALSSRFSFWPTQPTLETIGRFCLTSHSFCGSATR